MTERFSWFTWAMRSLRWRCGQSLAAALALGVAVASLVGSLVVGWSLQKSLEVRLHDQLAGVGYMVAPTGGYTPELPQRVAKLIDKPVGSFFSSPGVVAAESGKSIAASVWACGEFQPDGWSVPHDLAKNQVILSDALARDLGAGVGDWVVVRMDLSSTKPADGIFSYQDPADLTRTFRLQVRSIGSRGGWADFSSAPNQQRARNAFVSLDLLPANMRQNCLLFPEKLGPAVIARSINRAATREDIGLRLQGPYLQSRNVIIGKNQAEVLGLSVGAGATCTHIAEELASPHGATSYGVIAAAFGSEKPSDDEIVLNQWVADALKAKAGDKIDLVALTLPREGRFERKRLELTVADIRPIGSGLFDQRVTPQVDGMTDASRIGSWKTPFPVDLKKVSPQDEQYWDKYRTTPKAIVSWNVMQALWRSSGYDGTAVTGMLLPRPEGAAQRIEVYGGWLNVGDPSWRVRGLGAEMRAAAVGSTDFQSLFVSMSMFIIAAAVVIAAGVMASGIDSRCGEIGMATAMGVASHRWRWMILFEQVAVCLPGAAIGLAGGVVYAKSLAWLFGALARDVWEVPPIQTDVHWGSAVVAILVVVVVSLAVAWVQVWKQMLRSPRELLEGIPAEPRAVARWRGRGLGVAVVLIVGSIGMVVAARQGLVAGTVGFFTAAVGALLAGWWVVRALLLPSGMGSTASLLSVCVHLATPQRRRAMLTFCVFAAGTFIICAVALFRGSQFAVDSSELSGPTGGFVLQLTSPLGYRSDLALASGRERFGLPASLPDGIQIYSLQSSSGSEGGCRNLAAPGEMQVLGVGEDWIARGGFDVVTQGYRGNPWELLESADPREAVPVFGDEETMQWIEHRKLGEVFSGSLNHQVVHMKLVGLVRGGMFSGQLLMVADQLRSLLGKEAAYRYHFVEAKPGMMDEAAKAMAPLQEFGFAIEPTSKIIEGVRSVQALYMTLFLVLGGLGLLLGVGGSVVVLLRDGLQRRSEMALLQAAGLSRKQATAVLAGGHVVPLAFGVAVGAVAALLGYLALAREISLLWPVLVCIAILVFGTTLLVLLARVIQPASLAGAMRVG